MNVLFIKNTLETYTSGKEFCKDECLVPFQGTLIIKTYPEKKNK